MEAGLASFQLDGGKLKYISSNKHGKLAEGVTTSTFGLGRR
jgi:hypothetical protein